MSYLRFLKNKNSNIYLFWIFLLSISSVLFISYSYDWQWDEAWTYRDILNNSLWDLLTYSKFKYANNHLINSFYFKLLQYCDIKNVLIFRLLSVLGFII